uniref:Major facilitator superfamily (MFS) profile domain-containing protein n=1 Tax=Streptomyces sp. NBC_01401 TaxID=2903854 RepID=A0AAU3H5L7_9ACTN
MAAPVGGLSTGALGSVLLAAAWRACDVGVNGAANGLALVFYGALLAITSAAWWGALIGCTGRRNLAVALLGGTAGSAVMVWIFVALLRVPDGYGC